MSENKNAIALAVIIVLGFGVAASSESSHGGSSSSSSPGGTPASVAVDPGVRAGAPGAGQPIAVLTAGELEFFNRSAEPTFSEIETVSNGLGPRFNLNSCAGCHAFPSVGGSSPLANPEVSEATAIAPGNTIPSFLSLNGRCERHDS